VFFFFIGAICFADDDYEKNFLWLLSERDLKIQQDMSRLSFFSTLSLSLSLSLSLLVERSDADDDYRKMYGSMNN